MAGKTRRPCTHALKYLIYCEWCGEVRKTTRRHTKSCGATCRYRLYFYRERLGYSPDSAPGKVSAAAAVAAEVARLVEEEKRRRAAAAAGKGFWPGLGSK